MNDFTSVQELTPEQAVARLEQLGDDLRQRATFALDESGLPFKAHPHLARIDQIAPGNPADIEKLSGRSGTLDKAPFRSPVTDFYTTNPIARASAIMAQCSALARGERAVAAE